MEELEDQGIHQGTIRLSIGTENIEDILDDLKGGFEALRASGLAEEVDRKVDGPMRRGAMLMGCITNHRAAWGAFRLIA